MLGLKKTIVLTAFLSLVGLDGAWAATFTVDDSGDTNDASTSDGVCADSEGRCTLRAAIRQANATGGADEIVFAVDETIVLGDSLFISGDTTVSGNGMERTVIDGSGELINFEIGSGDRVHVKDIAFQNMQEIGNEGGNLVLENVSVTGFASPYLHAVMNKSSGTLSLISCRLSENDDGAIYNLGTMTISETTIFDNVTDAGAGGNIGNKGTLTVVNSLIRDNLSRNGGALWNYAEGTAYVVNSTLAGNSALYSGGGIYNEGEMGLYNATVTANIGDVSDSICGYDAGGGVYNEEGATLSLANSLIAGNTDSAGAINDCYGEIVSEDYNLIGETQDCALTGETAHNILGQETGLAETFSDEGGSTEVIALEETSPAVDAGNPSGCMDQNGDELAGDQRGDGFARTSDGDGDGEAICDIGAYEIVVTETGCSDGEDNDGNGAMDCEDTACAEASECVAGEGSASADEVEEGGSDEAEETGATDETNGGYGEISTLETGSGASGGGCSLAADTNGASAGNGITTALVFLVIGLMRGVRAYPSRARRY